MWIRDENKWMEEPELHAYISEIKKERDEYKQELIELLSQVADCGRVDCEGCKWLYSDRCLTKAFAKSAKQRLEELQKCEK